MRWLIIAFALLMSYQVNGQTLDTTVFNGCLINFSELSSPSANRFEFRGGFRQEGNIFTSDDIDASRPQDYFISVIDNGFIYELKIDSFISTSSIVRGICRSSDSRLTTLPSGTAGIYKKTENRKFPPSIDCVPNVLRVGMDNHFRWQVDTIRFDVIDSTWSSNDTLFFRVGQDTTAIVITDRDEQDLAIGGSGPSYQVQITNGSPVTISADGIVSLSEPTNNDLRITATEVDGSVTNELMDTLYLFADSLYFSDPGGTFAVPLGQFKQDLDISQGFDPTLSLTNDATPITIEGLGSVTVLGVADIIRITGTDSVLTEAQVKDFAGELAGGTETGINVTYDSGTKTFTFASDLTDEGVLSVEAGSDTSAIITTNSSGAQDVELKVTGGLTLSENTSTHTILIDGSGVAGTDNQGFTITDNTGVDGTILLDLEGTDNDITLKESTNIDLTVSGNQITVNYTGVATDDQQLQVTGASNPTLTNEDDLGAGVTFAGLGTSVVTMSGDTVYINTPGSGGSQNLTWDENTRELGITSGNTEDLSEGIQDEVGFVTTNGTQTRINVNYSDIDNAINWVVADMTISDMSYSNDTLYLTEAGVTYKAEIISSSSDQDSLVAVTTSNDTLFLTLQSGEILNTVVDPSVTNEGSLTTTGISGGAKIQSNTEGSTDVTLSEAGIVEITNQGGNNIQISATEVDGSTSNELQEFDVTSVSSDIKQIALSNSTSYFRLSAGPNITLGQTDSTITIEAASAEVIDTTFSRQDTLFFVIAGDTSFVVIQDTDTRVTITGDAVETLDDAVSLVFNADDFNTNINGTEITVQLADGTDNYATSVSMDDSDMDQMWTITIQRQGLSDIFTNVDLSRYLDDTNIRVENNNTEVVAGADAIDFSSNFSTTTESTEVNIDLSNTGVPSGSYGNASNVATFTVDSKGRLTNAGTVAIAFPDNSNTNEIQNLFQSITDGTTPAPADSDTDVFKLRSANSLLTIVTENDNVTHGDNALFTIDNDLQNYDNTTTQFISDITITVADDESPTPNTSTISNGGTIVFDDADNLIKVTESNGTITTVLDNSVGSDGQVIKKVGGVWSVGSDDVSGGAEADGVVNSISLGAAPNYTLTLGRSIGGALTQNLSALSDEWTIKADDLNTEVISSTQVHFKGETGISTAWDATNNELEITNDAPEATSVGDTPTLDLTLSGTDITGTVEVSAGVGNRLTAEADGLFVPAELDGDDSNEIQNLFESIAVAGQVNVVADQAQDVLTLIGGGDLVITTNSSGDAITFTVNNDGFEANTDNQSISVDNVNNPTLTLTDEGSGSTVQFTGGNNITTTGSGTNNVTIDWAANLPELTDVPSYPTGTAFDYVLNHDDATGNNSWVSTENWDKDASDDFSGNYTDLDFTSTTGLADGVDNDTRVNITGDGTTTINNAEDIVFNSTHFDVSANGNEMTISLADAVDNNNYVTGLTMVDPEDDDTWRITVSRLGLAAIAEDVNLSKYLDNTNITVENSATTEVVTDATTIRFDGDFTLSDLGGNVVGVSVDFPADANDNDYLDDISWSSSTQGQLDFSVSSQSDQPIQMISTESGNRLTVGTDNALHVPAEIDPVWVAAEPNYGNLTQNEIITGNWVNTANPWAVNELVSDVVVSGEGNAQLVNDAGYITERLKVENSLTNEPEPGATILRFTSEFTLTNPSAGVVLVDVDFPTDNDTQDLGWTQSSGVLTLDASPDVTIEQYDGITRGLVPDRGAANATTTYLRADGNWVTPPDNSGPTYTSGHGIEVDNTADEINLGFTTKNAARDNALTHEVGGTETYIGVEDATNNDGLVILDMAASAGTGDAFPFKIVSHTYNYGNSLSNVSTGIEFQQWSDKALSPTNDLTDDVLDWSAGIRPLTQYGASGTISSLSQLRIESDYDIGLKPGLGQQLYFYNLEDDAGDDNAFVVTMNGDVVQKTDVSALQDGNDNDYLDGISWSTTDGQLDFSVGTQADQPIQMISTDGNNALEAGTDNALYVEGQDFTMSATSSNLKFEHNLTTGGNAVNDYSLIFGNPTSYMFSYQQLGAATYINVLDPAADRIVFWDETTNRWDYLTAGTGLEITGTTINNTEVDTKVSIEQSGTEVIAGADVLNFSANFAATNTTDLDVDVDLSNTAVSPGSYGDGSNIATFTVDAKGRLTAAGTVPVVGDGFEANTDETVKISANETAAGYLQDQFSFTNTSGNALVPTVLNEGANEVIQVNLNPANLGLGLTLSGDNLSINTTGTSADLSAYDNDGTISFNTSDPDNEAIAINHNGGSGAGGEGLIIGLASPLQTMFDFTETSSATAYLSINDPATDFIPVFDTSDDMLEQGVIGSGLAYNGTTLSVPVMTNTTRGLAPDGDGIQNGEFLREDGVWAIPSSSGTLTVAAGAANDADIVLNGTEVVTVGVDARADLVFRISDNASDALFIDAIDPNADKLVAWDESANSGNGELVYFGLGSGLTFNGTNIELDVTASNGIELSGGNIALDATKDIGLVNETPYTGNLSAGGVVVFDPDLSPLGDGEALMTFEDLQDLIDTTVPDDQTLTVNPIGSNPSIVLSNAFAGLGTITFTGDQGVTVTGSTGTVGIDVKHDNLSDFVANEHIDHSAVDLTAGNGLSGGGNITTSRTFTVNTANSVTVVSDNVQLVNDASSPGNDYYYGTDGTGTKGWHTLPSASYTAAEGVILDGTTFELGQESENKVSAYITQDRFLNFLSSQTNQLVFYNYSNAIDSADRIFYPAHFKATTDRPNAQTGILFEVEDEFSHSVTGNIRFRGFTDGGNNQELILDSGDDGSGKSYVTLKQPLLDIPADETDGIMVRRTVLTSNAEAVGQVGKLNKTEAAKFTGDFTYNPTSVYYKLAYVDSLGIMGEEEYDPDVDGPIAGYDYSMIPRVFSGIDGTLYQVFRVGDQHTVNGDDGWIYGRKSEDGGVTWTGMNGDEASSETIVLQESDLPGGNGEAVNNVTGFVTPTGRIVVLYGHYDKSPFAMIEHGVTWSDDGGATWSGHHGIGLFGGGTNQGPSLSTECGVRPDGTICIPINWKDGSGNRFIRLIESQDNGETWSINSGTVFDHINSSSAFTNRTAGPGEPVLADFGDGIWGIIFRNLGDDDNFNHAPGIVFSYDYGQTWSDDGTAITWEELAAGEHGSGYLYLEGDGVTLGEDPQSDFDDQCLPHMSLMIHDNIKYIAIQYFLRDAGAGRISKLRFAVIRLDEWLMKADDVNANYFNPAISGEYLDLYTSPTPQEGVPEGNPSFVLATGKAPYGVWVNGDSDTGNTSQNIITGGIKREDVVDLIRRSYHDSEAEHLRSRVYNYTASGNSLTLNFRNRQAGIHIINMTGASATYQILTEGMSSWEAGIYTIFFQNVPGTVNLNTPANWLDQTGSAFDGGTTYTATGDFWITGLFDGTNFYVK